MVLGPASQVPSLLTPNLGTPEPRNLQPEMYELDITKSVDRFLKRLQPKQFRQIVQTILKLRIDPRPPDSKNLKGSPDYKRVDIGEFRIIYRIERETVKIAVVGKRNDDEVYKKFGKIEP